MNKKFRTKNNSFIGFTLIEMLLVMVIIGMILYASIGYMQQRTQAMRIDKTTITMQQILNAAMAYYIVYAHWPAEIPDLQANGYLPNIGTLNNPWGQPYLGKPGTPLSPPSPSIGPPPQLFYVWTTIPKSTGATASVVAQQIASMLPLGYVTYGGAAPPITVKACPSATDCLAVGNVNIPGQNLNNANAVTFAGVYQQGGCVPVPQCPEDNNGNFLTPSVMVAPVSIGGYNDTGTQNTYPITSFTAYATGTKPKLDKKPPPCTDSSPSLSNTNATPDCSVTPAGGTAASAYWRACAKVVTQKGDVQIPAGTNTTWGKDIYLMAITRCSINAEPSGTSGFNIWGN